MPVLANPLGLLALLGIPAVLAIHFLQRKAVEVPISTLFLLDFTRRDAASGRRIDRLIPSIPLWMQLLAVLLLAWFLAEPRYHKAGAVQRVAVVVDSSASMQVFKADALDTLATELSRLRDPGSSLEITVLESAPGRPRLYAGSSAEEMRLALADWEPRDGLIDPAQSLRLARSLVSINGTVIYLTDTPAENLPYDTRLLAVGEPIDNVGFTGVSFAEIDGVTVWRALVRNYGNGPAERTWSVRTATGASEPRPIRVEPGGLLTLQSVFPAEGEQVTVVLTPDRFTADDILPLVKPVPKTLAISAFPPLAGLGEKLLRSLDATTSVPDPASADLSLFTRDPSDADLLPGNAIVFARGGDPAGSYVKGGIVAEPHPLLDGLNWQALIARETPEFDRLPGDRVLLWQDRRPLIFLRQSGGARQLCFNFDFELSNAGSQPAFIVLLHRFAQSVRDGKVAPSAANLETSQPLRITAAPDLPLEVTATDSSGNSVSHDSAAIAPPDPGFLTIRQSETTLLNAAVHFADTREADFSACGSASDLAETATAADIRRATHADPLWRIWILLLLAAMLVSWKFNKSATSAATAG